MKNNDKKKKVLFRYLKDKINLIIHILYDIIIIILIILIIIL